MKNPIKGIEIGIIKEIEEITITMTMTLNQIIQTSMTITNLEKSEKKTDYKKKDKNKS